MGTLIDPVPVTGLAPNLSPMPRIASAPLGSEIAGAEKTDFSVLLLSSCGVCGVIFSLHLISFFQTPTRLANKNGTKLENPFPTLFFHHMTSLDKVNPGNEQGVDMY
jgi:hypothetical protein